MLGKRLSYANVTASLALFLTLGGVGYAAAQLPNNSVGTPQLKANAVTSGKVKNGSLLKADFKAGQLPKGAKGATGAAGPAGPAGPAGAAGAVGPAGPFPATLPSGKTLTGTYAIAGYAGTIGTLSEDSVSFAYPLTAILDTAHTHYIKVGDPAVPQCPGTPAVPSAAAGNLCIYENVASNATSNRNIQATNGSLGTTGVTGGRIYMFSTAVGDYEVYGSWAVTAA